MFTKQERGEYMNIQESDILNALAKERFSSQRELAEYTGYSLGTINKGVKALTENGYIDEHFALTEGARKLLKTKVTKKAIILAAGYGMRMVPINTERPKGLLEVRGETLIERIIRQLHEVNIRDITVVVGFMKEQYEFLIDDYGVKLLVNPEYGVRNNLHSLYLAGKDLAGTYIIPCDIYCTGNPFSITEMYSWYMVTTELSKESDVKVNRKKELALVGSNSEGNKMIGIAYIDKEDADIITGRLEEMDERSEYDKVFWEQSLYIGDRMIISSRCVSSDFAIEINTYEQLREIDRNSGNLKIEAIDVICKALNVQPEDIKDIKVMKKGMTNRSFIFSCMEKKYIMRIPGEGTDRLINRKEEADVYNVVKDKNICDNIIYINPENGYKITEFMENTRVCDPLDESDVKKCMAVLKKFHSRGLTVNHRFDIYGQMDFYESLWGGTASVYRDYKVTKEKCLRLKEYIDKQDIKECLTHIDAVPDNFLFDMNGEDEKIRLIDWEYAGMQDPHVDIAMFSIYSFYDKEQIDRLIDIYFEGECDINTRIKIYCYVAICGLLWSNWCEYKRNLGVEFGEYALRQYRYAKDFYSYAKEEMAKIGE